jgi:signal transduction histidine kinase
VVFIVCVLVVLCIAYVSASQDAARRNDLAIEREFNSLVDAYATGGWASLNEEVIERSAIGGALSYTLQDGTTISGSYSELPKGIVDPGANQQRLTFRIDDENSRNIKARGLVGRVMGGPILLVARDNTEFSDLARDMAGAFLLVGLATAGLSILAGLFAGYYASSRLAELTNAVKAAAEGDLTQKVPETKWGDEFDKMARQCNLTFERLNRQVQATEAAGDAIAHDMRSPLTRLRGRLEEALRNETLDPSAQRAALLDALEETEHLLDTFKSIFDLAQIRNADRWDFERFKVSAVMDMVLDLFEAVADDRNIALSHNLARSLHVNGDPKLVMQAVTNVMDNALKYTPSGGRIELRLRSRADDTVEISIADSGPGIPAEDRSRVHGRFVRLDKTRNSPGVGLGLSLVHAVVELHKGRLILDDGLDLGTGPGLTVSLILPGVP